MADVLEELAEIDTERLLLRVLKPGDVQPVYEIYSHPNVICYWHHRAWTAREEAAAFVRASHDGFSTYTLFVWCVFRRGSGEVIAICAVRDYLQEHRTAEVLCTFHPNDWSLEYLSEVLPELVAFGFDSLLPSPHDNIDVITQKS